MSTSLDCSAGKPSQTGHRSLAFSAQAQRPSKIFRLESLACVFLAAGVATMVATSRVSEFPTSDSILFSIISLQKLLHYYWEQNRVGSLLPFLVSPVRDIHSNFYLQVWLRSFAAALTPAFLIFVIRPRMPLLLSFSAALIAMFAILRTEALIPYWLDGSPYALSLAIFTVAAGLLTTRKISRAIRVPAAVAIGLLASWVNIGMIVILAPILALFAVLRKSRAYVALLELVLVCFLLERAHSLHYAPITYDGLVFAPALQFAGLTKAIYRSILILPFGALVVLIAFCMWRSKPADWSNLALFLLACACTIVITSATAWFLINGFHPRYLSAPITLMVGATGISAAQIVYDAAPRWRSRMAGGFVVLALVVCAWNVQPRLAPKWTDQATDAITEVAIRSDIHLVVGDYWRVWPVVFEIINRRGSIDTYGLTVRGSVMMAEIREKLAADSRFICVDKPANCRNQISFFIGSEEYKGKSMDEAMVPVTTSSDPDFVVYELR